MTPAIAKADVGLLALVARLPFASTRHLAVLSGEPASAQEWRAADIPTLGQATILVVDDDAGVREIAVNALQELGYRTLEAENGPAALERLAQILEGKPT